MPMYPCAHVPTHVRRVIGFEPVPHFHAFYEYSVHVNGLAKLVDMRGNVVSHVTDTTLMMVRVCMCVCVCVCVCVASRPGSRT